MDNRALFNIGYGLYVLTTKDGDKDNGCIVNTVMQITSNPVTVAVGVNKQNLSADLIKKTKKLNISVLTEQTPFSVFKQFGFSSGKTVNKFEGQPIIRANNGIAVIKEFSNSLLSLKVNSEQDLSSHYLFICEVEDAEVFSTVPSVTYNYYQAKIKPKPAPVSKEPVWRCNICNYEHKGEFLPDDFICPICKHPKSDFTKIN